ncbi:ATPase [Natronomonas gomsonensis]|jgi:chromosome segregation ATPase|uniref:archaea-specific SMC-related protein n=1 Tax=Natronomonas gomsonensis TaxID=1046043 RepID=UPI0020CA8BD9|nr:archaea-specific SMC-related protein [Natronomonas gomsonensis]MCY4730023.1 ATPase [Natronomonas gomsonensis]
MTWNLEFENIAGIREGAASLEPGINAVRGTNWQGKSSFVTAIETVMGTETVLTEGEDSGAVQLETAAETYRVELNRDGETIVRSGEPYLESEKARVTASLYAFLDDTNDVREAVRQDDNLETVLTRPLDLENIDERIAELSRERDQVETELQRAEKAAEQLSDTQVTIERLEDELEELETRREDIKEGRQDEESVSDRRDELSDAKAKRDSVEKRIERLEQTIDRTTEKLEEKREELDALEVPAEDEDLASRIKERKDRLNRVEQDAELLQSVYAPTKRLIDEDRVELITDIDRDLLEDSIHCWTCGSETSKAAVEENLDALGERISELREQANEYRSEVTDLQERQEKVKQAQRRESDLEDEIARLESTIEERETSLEGARERREELASRIDELSEIVEAEDDELTEVESQIKYTETRLEEVQEELETLESQAEQRDTLEAERKEMTDEINRLRDRKSEIKRRTREAFDDAIQDILAKFDVGFEMVRLTSEFELVVARDGREASLDALSEGELELLGIVAALAGYEAFDATDDIPVMLLDGLGGLADENLQTLIQYLEDRVDFLVFTTYPETTSFEANTIDPREWSVVSPMTAN